MAYKIVLDAGHGGEDPGAVYKDRKEKDDNLKLTLAVGKILEENGVDVVYTRTTDIYQTPFEKAKAAALCPHRAAGGHLPHLGAFLFAVLLDFELAL